MKAAEQSAGTSSDDHIYKTFLKIISQYDLTGDLLDFGAGVGNFTRALAGLNRFHSVTGVDIMERPADLPAAIKWLAADLNSATSFPDRLFDVIVSPEVIEHLENPRATIREWNRLLKPKGTLLFSTPNNESLRALMALLLQGHFVHFGDASYPAHITALVGKDFERISKEAGFAKPQFFFSNSGCIPKMPSVKWQTISFNLLKGKRFSDNIILMTRKEKDLN